MINLIELWGEEGIQQQLDGAKRNKHVYDKLAKELQKKALIRQLSNAEPR